MAFVDAVSNSTTAANTDALLFPAISNSLLIVRAGVYLTASGSNSHAINAPADNLTLAMDGYAAAENASAILFTAHSEILIGASGVVASGDRAIEGSGSDNEIINNGSLASNGYGIYLASSGHTVTNNGAILSGSLSGIFIAEGNSRVTNAGVLTTGGAGISILVVGTLSNSLVTNSGQINADYIGISLQGSDVLVSNSGTIQSIAEGIFGDGTDTDDYIITNSGTITSGASAIHLGGGNNSVDNSGSISSGDYAVVFEEANNILSNSSQITAKSTTATVFALHDGLKVTNSGEISGVGLGILAQSSTGTVDGTGTGNHDVTNDGSIVSASETAVGLYGANNTITNNGSIQANSFGLASFGKGTIVNTGTVTAGGIYAIVVQDIAATAAGTFISNSGMVIADNYGGIGAIDDDAVVDNSGDIIAHGIGISIGGTGAQITNTGTIAAGEQGIVANGIVRIVNAGTIQSMLIFVES